MLVLTLNLEFKHATTDCNYHSINPFTLSSSPLFKHISHSKVQQNQHRLFAVTTSESYRNLWDCWENYWKSEVTSVLG